MKRLPSIKTLAHVFENPKEARRILELRHAELSAMPAAWDYVHKCLNAPAWYRIRMEVLNALDPGLHGVEGTEINPGEWLTYLNTGETYAATLCYWHGRYIVSSWGDIVEKHQKEREQ